MSTMDTFDIVMRERFVSFIPTDDPYIPTVVHKVTCTCVREGVGSHIENVYEPDENLSTLLDLPTGRKVVAESGLPEDVVSVTLEDPDPPEEDETWSFPEDILSYAADEAEEDKV